ncbi:DUF2243 domain-containing protein [Planococcus sp. CP5-4]|uniref:DUF2243 domain-containing protein n=1 Tax=unclassified Planococcus (in: firmicutes) TaxID=2662419 RepID=UPI001C2365EE|nr:MULTISPECIES: DUF2243 domain-containing protein [unclassified Planococcus (in: firmicutes)]MBU9674404.1 DUF2243 domain-containing protein [Planococcus sp. CP5-4_YE]MBV0909008.1 DUF2243 domain-containing protein [Planococcus sp. CP5-4_UN]MBW6065096.1 DUF2243 domain-containing protein [Planococcus sp. CP5-4]
MEKAEQSSTEKISSNLDKRNFWAGLLFGIGLMAFIDEVIFHQLLQWHHFYDLATPQIGILADGLLNSFAWFAAIGGLFMFADLRRRQALRMRYWIGSILIGAGAFQLFDGIIDHKVFRIHQVRYQVELWPYDLSWNLFGAALLIAGIILAKSAKERRSA